jgi:hypothetical protein
MLSRNNLLLGASALLLSAAPLTAADAAAPMGFAGAIGGAYGQSSCEGCDSSDAWTLGGSGAFGFGPSFGAQVDASYSGANDNDIFGLGGSLFWAPVFGRLGASVQWQTTDDDFSGFTIDVNALTYGVFGEFYLGNFLTVAAKGGGLSVDFDDGTVSATETGSYAAAALTGYVMPNLALQADVTFGGIDDFFDSGESLDTTAFAVGAEYLVSEMVPVAIFGGYSFGNVEFLGVDTDVDTWVIGVRFYFGAAGPTLVDKHRNGSLGWVGATNVNALITP